MAIPGLSELERADPAAARQITATVKRLVGTIEAGRRALDHLPTFQRAESDSELLGALVVAVRALLPDAEVWAVAWEGELTSGRASFHAFAGPGERLPSPTQISRTLLSELERQSAPLWVDDPSADDRLAGAASLTGRPGHAAGAVAVGVDGAVCVTMPGALPAPFDRQQVELLAALAGRCREGLRRVPGVVPPPVPGLIGESAPMRALRSSIHAFGSVPWPALVLGETGSGKELVARGLHLLSRRSAEPFVAVNAAAIPEELAESTLFGHERGAFTGAERRREGLLDRTGAGTLFLDEIGDISPRVQARLLRLLQENVYERVGGEREIPFPGRIVAATLRPIDRASAVPGFRSDLYFRLSACTLRVPPLRERPEDIPALARHLASRAVATLPGAQLTLSDECVAMLTLRTWPGNVRELENVIRTGVAVAHAQGARVIRPRHLPSASEDPPTDPRAAPSATTPFLRGGVDGYPEALLPATELFQQRAVRAALLAEGGNRVAAARRLGVSKQWLHRLLSRWGDLEQGR